MTELPGAPGPADGDRASASASDGDPGAAAHQLTGLELARTIAGSVGKQVRRRREPTAQRRERVDPQVSGAHPDERDPALLSAALHRLVESRGWSTEVNVHTVLGRWEQVVGPEVAAHSVPEAYADAVLTVRTDSTAWATQLRAIASIVVAKLNTELGEESVTRIVVRGPDAPSWKRGPRSVRGRGPRDTYG